MLLRGLHVCSGSSLCENSDVELARRKFVSITFNNKGTALTVTVERRKERKQFCAFSARACCHTAWVINGRYQLEMRRPLFPRKQTWIGPARAGKLGEFQRFSPGGLFGFNSKILRMNQAHRSASSSRQRIDHPPPRRSDDAPSSGSSRPQAANL